jgi:O-antigen/teichoic acid export membrane protein
MTTPHRKTLRLTGTYLLGNLFCKGAKVLMLPLYTTYIFEDKYGTLNLLNVSIMFLALLVVAPLVDGALDRYYYHPRYAQRNGQLLFNVFLLLLLQSAAIAGAYLLLAETINHWLFPKENLLGLVQLYAAVLVLIPMWSLMLTLVKLREIAWYLASVLVVGTVLSCVTAFIGLTVLNLGAYAMAYALIVEYGSAVLLILPVFLKQSTFKPSLEILREPLRYGYPLAPTGALRMLMRVMDNYILLWFGGGLATVGVYGLGYSVAESVDSSVVNPLFNGVVPTIRQMESDPARQKKFIRSAATMYYTIAVFVALGVALYSNELVHIVGRKPGFWACQPIVPIVAMAFVMQSLGIFTDWGLVMHNKSLHITVILLIVAAVNIGLDFLLVPHWGIYGAAVAMLTGCVVWNAMRMYFSARLYDLHFELGRLAHATLIGVALYLLSLPLADPNLAWGLGPTIANLRWPLAWTLGIKALLAAAFPVLCLATGLLTAEEKALLRSILAGILRRRKALTPVEEPQETSPRK